MELARTALRDWYARARRPLPWRDTEDPYAIWVSEVMLQQTRVETVVPYYTRFLARFPTVGALAAADEAEVLALWSGIGYYRRARMLHLAARRVADVHGGRVPGDWAALRALPGVGDYTAGAVGSIAFGLRVPVVDGNVERVLARLHAIPGDPRSVRTRAVLWTRARAFADADRPGDVNQALMELGATVCVPLAPRCGQCPVRVYCAGHREGRPERYPEKRPRAAPREERWCALVARRGGAVWLEPSTLGRWRGMLLPPLVPEPAGRARGARWLAGASGARAALARVRERAVVVHLLSHAKMIVRVFSAEVVGEPPRGSLVPVTALRALAVPRITERLLAAVE